MTKLKSSGYKGGNIKTSPKITKNPIEENIQNDQNNFLTLIQNRYINSELSLNDIEIYIQCLKELKNTGSSNTGMIKSFKLQYMIPVIERSLESSNLFSNHLTQQIEYLEKMLLDLTQKEIQPSRTRPKQGKISKENYKGGSVSSKDTISYNLSKEQKIVNDINTFLEGLSNSYLNTIYTKEDLECYIDCLNHFKSSTPVNHYPNNKSLHKVANFTQTIFDNNSISISHLNQQIEGIVKILTEVTPKIIEPKRAKPTQGKVSTLSKGYKK
tara:strand:- start:854 stop:1663 length:810 start_codon:yes stop_codon:yes gene_type:complete